MGCCALAFCKLWGRGKDSREIFPQPKLNPLTCSFMLRSDVKGGLQSLGTHGAVRCLCLNRVSEWRFHPKELRGWERSVWNSICKAVEPDLYAIMIVVGGFRSREPGIPLRKSGRTAGKAQVRTTTCTLGYEGRIYWQCSNLSTSVTSFEIHTECRP